MLWGTINTLQLFILVTLFSLNYPDNAMFMISLIGTISNFNLIPVDNEINVMFNFTNQNPWSDNFNTMGYNSCNILQNLNTVLLFVLAIPTAIFAVLILGLIIPQHSIFRPKFEELKKAVFFRTTFRILLESQIDLTLSAALNLMILNNVYVGDQVDTALTYIISIVMILTPPFTFIFALTQHRKVEDPTFKSKFGSLYEGLQTNGRIYLLSTFIFTSRRLLLIFTAVVLTDYPAFQIMIFILLSQINLVYLVYYRPFEDKKTNYNEIFNELCILSVGYQLVVFTDYMPNLDIRSQAGYGLIAQVLGNFVINILIQVVTMLKTLPLLFRRIKASKACRWISRKVNEPQKVYQQSDITTSIVEENHHTVENIEEPQSSHIQSLSPLAKLMMSSKIEPYQEFKRLSLKTVEQAQEIASIWPVQKPVVNLWKEPIQLTPIKSFTPINQQVFFPKTATILQKSEPIIQKQKISKKVKKQQKQEQKDHLAFIDDRIPYGF